MKFRTEIDITKADFSISHQNQIISMGSCFSEHIGTLLHDNKFNIQPNPFGILYNPASIAAVLKRVIAGDPFQEQDLVWHNNQYHSFMHHGSFSSEDKNETLSSINHALSKANEIIDETDFFLITFGTAYLFKHTTSNEVVSNCHKFPANTFIRERLTINQIVDEWSELISTIQEKNINTRFIFTVSPIRHWKDGAHENQLSKAILHLAIDELMQRNKKVHYFPAYELLIDDLRDYRFYTEDMMYPSSVAVDYIWNKYTTTYFNTETNLFIKSWERIKKSLQHRPNNKNQANYTIFVQQTYDRLKSFQKEHPLINFKPELRLLEQQLET